MPARDGRDTVSGVLDAPVRGREGHLPNRGSDWANSTGRRPQKSAHGANRRPPVPQTDTGGPAEHAEASGETAVKELGKTAP